jgi:hypothetical protein
VRAIDSSSTGRRKDLGAGSRALVALAGMAAASLLPAGPLAAQDDLGERITHAIRLGRENLLPRLRLLARDPPGDHPMGRIALPLAAALKAGAGTEDPIILQAFARLRDFEPRQTYDVACYLFALDALWQRKYRESLMPTARTTAAVARRASGEIRQKIAELVQWLVEARVQGAGSWTYGAASPGARNHDYSNAQFAILGLQIGLEHGVPIPEQVFVEIAHQFLRGQRLTGPPEEIGITMVTTLEELLRRKGASTRAAPSAERRYRAAPGGWDYTPNRSSPYASMTAAGASSLLVARNGLASHAQLKAQVEKALISAYTWIARNFASFTGGTRSYYYTLYSLEKTGDLGDIERFGPHDWYVEGAKELLKRQRENGSWGDYIDTSFALLFLTRATRLQAQAAPRILTNTQGAGGEADRDLVYVRQLDGFVSAQEVLAMVGENRRSDVIAVAEEIVRHYAPDARGDLVQHILLLWTGRHDQVTRFAKSALETITGERYPTRDGYIEWARRQAEIRALAASPRADAAAVARLLSSTSSLALRSQLLDVAQRHKLHELAPELVAEISKPLAAGKPQEALYRRKLHGLLLVWTGHRLSAPAGDDPARWAETAAAWRGWLNANGESFAIRGRVRELIERLASGRQADVGRALGELARLGQAALPHLLAETEREEYSFHVIEAIERLTGKSVGLRPAG